MTWHAVGVAAESPELYPGDIKSVLLREEQIQTRIAELGAQIGADYRDLAVADDRDLLLITVLKGAVMFVTDLARAIPLPTQFEFMAVSSYGSSTSSSGVVRILKDLDRDINDRDVLIVEDVVDSGLTLSWLLRNLATRHPHSCGYAHCFASRMRCAPTSTSPTWVSTSPTISWSATAWTTTSVTATCPTSGPWTPGSTKTDLLQLPDRGDREAHRLLAGLQRNIGRHARPVVGAVHRGASAPDVSEIEMTLPSLSPDSCAYCSARSLAS